MAYSKVVENFLRYVKIDTQSSEACTDKVPSTEKQHNLAKMLYYYLIIEWRRRQIVSFPKNSIKTAQSRINRN